MWALTCAAPRAPPARTSGALAAHHKGVAMPAPIQQLQQLRQDLAAQFPERREIIEGALYALLSSESVLLLGPPGTGKSSLVRAVAQAFGARYFERLLTKFSTPEEIFGPVSLRALENDRYTRVTTDKLPEAEIAVIDETFKANSAILNSLLTLMNERLLCGAPHKIFYAERTVMPSSELAARRSPSLPS